MSADRATDERLDTIETLLSHLQHDVDKLNEALISRQTEISELNRQLTKLTSAVDQIPQPPDNPLDERPPHY